MYQPRNNCLAKSSKKKSKFKCIIELKLTPKMVMGI